MRFRKVIIVILVGILSCSLRSNTLDNSDQVYLMKHYPAKVKDKGIGFNFLIVSGNNYRVVVFTLVITKKPNKTLKLETVNMEYEKHEFIKSLYLGKDENLYLEYEDAVRNSNQAEQNTSASVEPVAFGGSNLITNSIFKKRGYYSLLSSDFLNMTNKERYKLLFELAIKMNTSNNLRIISTKE